MIKFFVGFMVFVCYLLELVVAFLFYRFYAHWDFAPPLPEVIAVLVVMSFVILVILPPAIGLAVLTTVELNRKWAYSNRYIEAIFVDLRKLTRGTNEK